MTAWVRLLLLALAFLLHALPPAPPAAPQPVVRAIARNPPAPAVSPVPAVWACIAQHESGGNPAENTGNGYYGAFQFSAATWASMDTGYPRADLAPYSVQLAAAEALQRRAGWGQWPVTSRECGA